VLGMAPDLVSFGPFLISQWINPVAMDFPAYVHQTYNVTHSFLVWAMITSAVWSLRKAFPWVLGAWSLHILCDIPLHEISFFPTPYLWPAPTPLIDGIRWAQPRILIPNYIGLAITYAAMIGLQHRRRAAKMAREAGSDTTLRASN